MEQKLGYYAFGGMLIGALFGSGLGAANGNAILGLGFGALIGVALGWFACAAVSQQSAEHKDKE